MTTERKLIEKLEELIYKYRIGGYYTDIDIKELESEIASLEQQLKLDQCNAIIGIVKEAWTPEKTKNMEDFTVWYVREGQFKIRTQDLSEAYQYWLDHPELHKDK